MDDIETKYFNSHLHALTARKEKHSSASDFGKEN
jgi:hypothetical protein